MAQLTLSASAYIYPQPFDGRGVAALLVSVSGADGWPIGSLESRAFSVQHVTDDGAGGFKLTDLEKSNFSEGTRYPFDRPSGMYVMMLRRDPAGGPLSLIVGELLAVTVSVSPPGIPFLGPGADPDRAVSDRGQIALSISDQRYF